MTELQRLAIKADQARLKNKTNLRHRVDAFKRDMLVSCEQAAGKGATSAERVFTFDKTAGVECTDAIQHIREALAEYNPVITTDVEDYDHVITVRIKWD